MARPSDRPTTPRQPIPAQRTPPPLPLNYFPRPVARPLSRGLLLVAAVLLVGSLFFGIVGTYVVLRVGRNPQYGLLSAVVAPIIFAAGLGGFLHSLDMARSAAGRRRGADGATERGEERPPGGG